MKKISYIFAFLLSLFYATGEAGAETQSPYKLDFNGAISTTANDFRAGTGWGHLVESASSYGSNTYVSYTYSATDGVDGTGALKVGSQSLGSGWNKKTVNDLLVTPPVTGEVSVYVKQVSSSGSVKFYTVTKSGSTYKRGTEITLEATPVLSTSEYVKVELPEQEAGTLVGIRGENVYLDDFEATSAEIEPYKAITISGVTSLGGDSPDCTADGKFPVKFKVTYKNDGEVDLTPGMTGYSLDIVHMYDSVSVASFTPTATLAVGETATDTVSALVDYATYPSRSRYDVMENITKSTKYGAWIEPVAYAPALQVRYGSSRLDGGESYSYGMTNEAVGKEFKLTSSGAAPLTVTAVELPQGFSQDLSLPFTLEAHKDTVMTIVIDNTTPGIYSGDVTIKCDGLDDFKFGVSGTVLDNSKYFESFATKDVPQGMILEDNWTIEQRDAASSDNPYMAKNGRQDGTTKLITPLLKVTEGEKFSFDAARANYYSSGDGVYLNVYYSPDRKNWTLAKKITSDELSDTRAVSYSYYMGVLTNFVIDNIPAGNWYLGFEAGYTCVDNLYGFERVDVAHDLLLTDAKIPATASVNNKYTATVSVKNLKGVAEAADSYTVSLYEGGKVVAIAETPEIGASSDTTFTMSFVPHTVGTTTVYAEIKTNDGALTIKTDETEVAVAAEQAVNPVVVGIEDYTDKRVVFDWWNADVAGVCDFIYTKEMLEQSGLAYGDKISGFTFTGKPVNDKTLENVEMYAKYALVADVDKYEEFADTASMTTIPLLSKATVKFVSGEGYTTDIVLDQPVVWDGASAVRLFTYVKGSSYLNVQYPVDGENRTCYAKSASASSSTRSNTPIATFNIKLDPVTYAGTVKIGDTPVEGAELTLRSDDDVIYAGTTAADGAFSIPVIQTDKKYTLTVTAKDCFDFTQENVTVTSDPVEIVLKKKIVAVSGKVTYRGNALKGASVLLSHSDDNGLSRYEAVTGEDGTYAIDGVMVGYKYSVEVSADKFVGYTSADSVEIKCDTTLTDVALERVKVSVSGRALFHNAGVEGATVTMSRADGEGTEATATTDSDGKFAFAGVTPDYSYTMTIKKDGFNDYVFSPAVEVADTTVLADVVMTKPDFSFNASVAWGQTRLEGIKLECKYTDKDGKEVVKNYYTDKDGECKLDGFDAAYVYTFTAIDESGEFTITTDPVVVDDGNSTTVEIIAEANPVTITVESDGYTAYSYKRALDISGTGLEAYAVTDVKTNYTELAQLAAVPAKTGVLLKGNAGTYTVMPVEKAEGVDDSVLEGNLLAATYDEAYTITSEKVGKEWTLTRNGGMDVFKSVAGTTVPKGSAYLGYESGESIIYLNQTDGVMSIDASRQSSALDYTKPVYNLAGQQVGKDYKGVVIQNGKKYSVK